MALRAGERSTAFVAGPSFSLASFGLSLNLIRTITLLKPDTLEKLESMFASAKPRFHELDDLVKTLVDNAQVILKENWDRVREGEPVYRRTKWGLFIFAGIGAIAVASYVGFRLFKAIYQ
jgi:hypothetical protein